MSMLLGPSKEATREAEAGKAARKKDKGKSRGGGEAPALPDHPNAVAPDAIPDHPNAVAPDAVPDHPNAVPPDTEPGTPAPSESEAGPAESAD